LRHSLEGGIVPWISAISTAFGVIIRPVCFGNDLAQALADSKAELRFPREHEAPKHPLQKPETGRYHVVRLIRSDLKLNVFEEMFPVPPELQYEYVIATINVKEQKLKLFLDKIQVEEIKYKLR